MSRIREEIDIAATPEQVWAVVHRDMAGVAQWSDNLVRTEVIGGGPVGVGTELRYVVKMPAGTTVDLHLVVRRYDEFRRCSGTLTSALGGGTWEWTYRARRGVTHVVYEVEIKPVLALRFTAPLLERQAVGATRRNLEALKRRVESGIARR
jgi:Polyketide cyclase / dehydrase and lipid transport